MEFPFNINSIFPNEITLLDKRLTTGENGSNEFRRNRDQLVSVIDQMGIASSKAQGLNTVITSTDRLTVSAHHLYVLKDTDANNGYGAAVGILRVGQKKLFVYDRDGNNHELEPLCVLDFYVHESRQRTGCGKKLFQFMLQTEQRRPVDFAVDRPSPKFLAFLAKHYNLKVLIPQVNNFVIFEGFFTNNVDKDQSRRSYSQSNRLQSYANSYSSKGRLTGTQELDRNSRGIGQSPQEINFINEKDVLSHVTLPASVVQHGSATSLLDAGKWSSNRMHEQKPGKQAESDTNDTLTTNPQSGMGAQRSQYSRHMSAVSPVQSKPNEVTEIVVDRTKVYSPPLLRRRNGPTDESSHLGHGRLNQSGQDNRRTNIPQDTAPQTTDYDVLQSNDRKSSAVPGSWSQRNADPSWNKLAIDPPPGRFANSRKYCNHTRLW